MRVYLIAIVLSAVASSLSAQSLADVARQKGQGRQGAGAGKTYTNKDLKPVRQPAADAAAPAGADAQAPAAASSGDDAAKAASGGQDGKVADAKAADPRAAGDAEVKDQAYWAKRLTDLREQLERDQTFAEALQSRINVLTMDFINRDDRVQREQIERDRTRAIVELERVKKTIEDDKKAIADLEEEARRAGVPAGWLR